MGLTGIIIGGRGAPWKPVLSADLRSTALNTIHALSEALRPSIEHATDPSLMVGLAGVAVFYEYLARAGMGESHRTTANEALARAFELVEQQALPSGLAHGVAGVAWAADRLRLPGEDDACAEVDELLLQHVSTQRGPVPYDLVEGLVGIGVYALARLPRSPARRTLIEIVGQLERLADRRDGGCRWPTQAEHWPAELVTDDSPLYVVGAGHGVPSALAFLRAVAVAGIETERADALRRQGLRWLRAQGTVASDGRTCFPDWVSSRGPVKPTRLYGWCYGAVGVSLATALGADDDPPSWNEAMRWSLDELGVAVRGEPHVTDACVCHGSAGLGLMFGRLFQLSGAEPHREASRRWFERALQAPTPGNGLAGYSSDQAGEWRAEIGIAAGAAGVGLALLSAATELEPEWDQMFLMSRQAVGGGG